MVTTSQKTASCPSRTVVASMIASRQMGQLWVAASESMLVGLRLERHPHGFAGI